MQQQNYAAFSPRLMTGGQIRIPVAIISIAPHLRIYLNKTAWSVTIDPFFGARFAAFSFDAPLAYAKVAKTKRALFLFGNAHNLCNVRECRVMSSRVSPSDGKKSASF